jgi:hypothetical protein
MTPLRKSALLGSVAALASFSISFIITNWDRWQLERRHLEVWSIDRAGDDGWLFACVIAFVTYVLVFTPLLLFFRRQSDKGYT